MKKYLLLVILLFAGFTACVFENAGESQVDFCPVASNQNENYGGLQAALVLSSGIFLQFTVRNETGKRLYYNYDFRIDSLQEIDTFKYNRVNYINYGSTQTIYVQWPWKPSLPTGIYTFERDFFYDRNLTEIHTAIALEFGVIDWFRFAEDAPPMPEELQAWDDARKQRYLEFHIGGGASEIIVLASEVNVSRTEVAFSTTNLSRYKFMHGLDFHLLVYENGWKPAPTAIDFWMVAAEGIGMAGGDIIRDRFNFEWSHGELVNGRYMIMRHHSKDRVYPRTLETLMVEFIIDDNTPTSFDD